MELEKLLVSMASRLSSPAVPCPARRRAATRKMGKARNEAVEDGWWYSLMLPDLRVVVASMTDADLYKKLCKIPPDVDRRSIVTCICDRHVTPERSDGRTRPSGSDGTVSEIQHTHRRTDSFQ
jgi:hypothetical protein